MADKSNKTLVLLGLGVGLFLLWGRGASAKDATKGLTGVKMQRTASWEGTTADWAKTRFGSALSLVKANWAGSVDEERAKQIALSMLTHWSIETGAGAAEWNWNVGNILATDSQPYYTAKDISGNVYAFRAFDSLTDGVAAYIKLLSSPRYAAAAKLLADKPDEPDWYIALGHAGWFDPTKAKPASSWEAAASSFAARRANLAQYAQ